MNIKETKIIEMLTRDTCNILTEKSIIVDGKKHIIDESYSFEFGARPIKRYIQSEIETVIARAIISGSVDTKHKYIVDYKDKIFIRQ